MYDSAMGWPKLRGAIKEAQNGYGDTFLKLADEYTGRQNDGSYPNNEFDAGVVIDCLDVDDARTVEEIRSHLQTKRHSSARTWHTADLPANILDSHKK